MMERIFRILKNEELKNVVSVCKLVIVFIFKPVLDILCSRWTGW